MKIINDAKIHQHAVNKSSGDHVANVNGRHFSETSKHKSNYYTDLDVIINNANLTSNLYYSIEIILFLYCGCSD